MPTQLHTTQYNTRKDTTHIMATTTTTTKDNTPDKLVISIQIKRDEKHAPFIKAWESYASQPTNAPFSAANLALHAIADKIGFDMSTIQWDTRSTSKLSKEEREKEKELVKRLIANHDIMALGRSLIAKGVDVSDMFTPEQIATMKADLAKGL